MIVGMWMSREVSSIGPAESITDAASLMIAKHIRRLPVVERRADGPHLVGIVTTRDLFRASPVHINPLGVMALENLRSDISVSDVMKHQPITTTPEAPVEEAAQAMSDHKIGGIPVVEKGVLVGIVTESDIFRAFVAMLVSPSGSARITFSVAAGEDIFSVIYRLSVPRKVRVISLNTSLHHETPVCVVRVAGGDLDAFLDDVWRSGHHVMNVLRIP
jgi:acetoin utilization protein AcuB